jgi:hypothetical protein
MNQRDLLLLAGGAVVGGGLAILATGGRPEAVAPAFVRQVEVARVPDAPAANLELRALRLLVEGLGTRRPVDRGEEAPPAPGEDPGALREDPAALREEHARAVEPLLARWRAAAPGAERAAAMRRLAVPLFHLLEAGGSTEHLVTLEESAERGETAAERKWAMIATHRLGQPAVVDFLLARARSPHVEVRFYAVEGLAWVRGAEGPRAVEGVAGGLEDPDPMVRRIAAVSLGTIVGDPARAEAILAALGREIDAGAAAAMEGAVLRLDPERGRDRVAAARR